MLEKTQSAGRLIVITGPSGVGKGTLLQALFKDYPELHFSISATTRSPRPNETHGEQYYFLTRDEFEHRVQQSEFLEWAEFAGNLYGTPKKPIFDKIESGHTVILEIELEGARQVRETAPDALQVFILPPSMAELETRIRGRGQDSTEAITRRLERATVEVAASIEFDHRIINDDLTTAQHELAAIIFE